ncbi:12530_t:CDS:2, partial [Acaulospora colombiana]
MTQLTSPTQSPSKISYSSVATSDSGKWGQHIPEKKGRLVPQALPRTQSKTSNQDQRNEAKRIQVPGLAEVTAEERSNGGRSRHRKYNNYSRIYNQPSQNPHNGMSGRERRNTASHPNLHLDG